MKVNICILLVFAIGFLSCDDDDAQFTIDCLPTVLQDGVISFHPFNAGALTDESGNQNDLTNTSTATSTSDRNGNANCAYVFDNSINADEFLTTTNTNFLNSLSTFSVSIWYQPIDSTRSGGDFEVLLSRNIDSHCPNRRGEWSVGLFDCRKAVFGHNNSVWMNNIPNVVGCQETVNFLTDKWHHLVAVKNNDEYKIYLNGNLEETATGNAGCTNSYLAQDIGDLFIGKFYTGKIDDVIIYNRALAQQDVVNLYQLAECCE